ncbi:MAG TPA: glycosyltransferase family 4 protein [Solirubrobacteraceae bacterium]|nr:glycosyltransferase family 4 protein [Solirubrobacteraceae bacterium]
MADRSLHIAWLGPAPGEDGGVAGVATELLAGLAARGHRIDSFFPSAGQPLPPRVSDNANLTFTWGTSVWQWDRWYSRTRIAAFVSGMVARGLASVRLRRQIMERHRQQPFDLVYQFSSIESFALPPQLRRSVPLVIHPETHAAGELRALVSERRLGLRCHPAYRYAAVATVMLLRSLLQFVSIRRARLLVCISGVFRDHLVRDYRFPSEHTAVVPNPVRLERFAPARKAVGEPPLILVLGRVAVRKGIEDVVAVANLLHDRDVRARFRVVGGPSLWSDYTPLLADLPESAEYAGRVEAAAVGAELVASDVLLQASSYEPFALTVAEALAAGIPVVGTSEVGAIEGVDRSVAAEVAPGDVPAMADAIEQTLQRLRADPAAVRVCAREEAERLYAPEVVCEQISAALQRLVGGEREPLARPAPARAA